jgi:hypothetical protein
MCPATWRILSLAIAALTKRTLKIVTPTDEVLVENAAPKGERRELSLALWIF